MAPEHPRGRPESFSLALEALRVLPLPAGEKDALFYSDLISVNFSQSLSINDQLSSIILSGLWTLLSPLPRTLLSVLA